MKTESFFSLKSTRLITMGILISVIPILIIIQLVRIQTDTERVKELLGQQELFSGHWENIIPARGLIYDRWGNILAADEMVYEVGVELKDVNNPRAIALATSLVLNEDYNEMYGLASLEYSPQSAVYAVLKNNATREQVLKLQEMVEKFDEEFDGSREAPSLEGLRFKPHLQRVYPEKTLGSNILGFVSRDGKGYFGVEAQYNDRLAGKPREVWVWDDPNMVTRLPEVPDGASLVLTIDRAIQASMEKLIDQEVAATGSDSGTIVVLDPKTGEVLAMATTPRMDLNEFWRYGEIFTEDTPFNRAVSQAYEPGSVYKVLTMGAGLDSGAVKLDTSFLDTGSIEVGGWIINNWNLGAWGWQDMTGCMQHSLNVCLAWVATQMGPGTFYSYMQRYGIGHLSGIDLANENAGRLKMPGDSDWYEADLGTNSFGQGVSATPLQMAAAVSAMANNGKIMRPHVVRSTISKGFQTDVEKTVFSVPVKAETAHILTEMLARSLEIESSDALITGYRVAGKTGTAEIPTVAGYTGTATNASFVGWGPVDDPRFVVYVWLERPETSVWGSVVAAPVFRQAVERLVVLLDLPPDNIRQGLLGQ